MRATHGTAKANPHLGLHHTEAIIPCSLIKDLGLPSGILCFLGCSVS